MSNDPNRTSPIAGDRVRSFDFAEPGTSWGRWLVGEHERAAYIEGVFKRYVDRNGCSYAEILVEKDVFAGEEKSGRIGKLYYAPENGMSYGLGDEVCDFIELIEVTI